MPIDRMAILEKRECCRKKFNYPVNFEIKGNHVSGGCLSYDISLKGLRIYLSNFVAVGTQLNLQVNLGSRNFTEMVGQVVWLKRVPFSDRFLVGLKFIRLNSACQEDICGYIRL